MFGVAPGGLGGKPVMRGFEFRPVKLSIKSKFCLDLLKMTRQIEILLGFAVNGTACDVELLRDQRLQTQTGVIATAARRFVTVEAGQTGGGRIEVYPRCNSKID